MEPESQNAMFEKSTTQSGLENVPKSLKSATMRMKFPPSYVIVGVYRLCTDKLLYKPAWDKCRHGARRGIIAGLIWVSKSCAPLCTKPMTGKTAKQAIVTYRVQKKFIELFLSKCARRFISGYLTNNLLALPELLACLMTRSSDSSRHLVFIHVSLVLSIYVLLNTLPPFCQTRRCYL